MDSSIIVALITGALSILGVILSNAAANSKMSQQMTTQQAILDTKLEELTREVRAHNNFALRIPVLEEQLHALDIRVTRLETPPADRN